MTTGALADHVGLLRLGALITSCYLPRSYLLTEVKRVGLRVTRGLHVALLQRAARLALRHVDRVLLANRWRLQSLSWLHAAIRHLILELDLLLKLLLSVAAHLGALHLHVLTAYASIIVSSRLLHNSLWQTASCAEQLLSGC